MDNDFSSYQSLMNTDSTLNDISNILQQLQIIQSYFIQNPNYIIYSDGSSTYLKNSAIQDNTIDESKIINLTTDLGNKQPLADILTKLSALTYTNSYFLQSTLTGVQWTQIVFNYLFSNFVSDSLLLNQITTGTNNYVLAMSNAGTLNYQLLSDDNISSLSYTKITNYLNLTTSSPINLTWQQSNAVTNPISYFTMFKCVQPSYTKRYEWSINAYDNSTDNVNFYLNYYKNSTRYQILQFNRALMIIWNGCQIYDSLGGVLYCSNSSKITSANANYITYYQLNTECKTPIATLNGYFSAITNPLYLELHNGTSIQYITDSYINNNTISYSKISGADNSDYSILTKKAWMSPLYIYFGTTSYMFCNTTFLGSSSTTNFNYFLISPSNLFTMAIETPQNTHLKFIVNSQTVSNYYARIYYDQLATTTYLDFDQYLNAINIVGTLRNNNSSLSASQNYEYITKYFSDLTYQPKSNILTALNSWGTDTYILSTNGVNAVTWIANTPTIADNSLTYKKLIWQTQPSTINQYQFISYDYTNDKLTSSQYINSSTMIADGAIAGAKLTNSTISYSKLLTYNNPSDLQFLKYNLTQDKLEYVTMTGSFFSDNTITYNKLGTKTNNYAFIVTDSTHANIIEQLLNSTTNVNNYIASHCIEPSRINTVNTPNGSDSYILTVQANSGTQGIWYNMNSFVYTSGAAISSSYDYFTLTSGSYSSLYHNFNNTYSSSDNSVFFNSSISNSSYGTKQSIIQIRNYGGYMQYLLALDGYGMLYCSSQSNYISNGSSSSRGVNCPNWIYGGNICSGQSSFYGTDCITKAHADANYANINHYHVYNANFVQRSEGYYFRTYMGSYSDHTYFMSSYSTSSPGIGTSYTWAALICGGGSSNYVCEFRNYASQSSTVAYINSGGSYNVGSQKRLKNNIKKYDDIDDDNDFNIFNIIKNINISIFDYSNKEKKEDDLEHDNFKKKLIIEDKRETGIIIEDLEDNINDCKTKNKNKTADILQSFITYDHRLCDKNNDTLNCATNSGNCCLKYISYNSIYNLNVHATKKLIKKVEKQHDRITDLQTRLINLENLMNTLTNKT